MHIYSVHPARTSLMLLTLAESQRLNYVWQDTMLFHLITIRVCLLCDVIQINIVTTVWPLSNMTMVTKTCWCELLKCDRSRPHHSFDGKLTMLPSNIPEWSVSSHASQCKSSLAFSSVNIQEYMVSLDYLSISYCTKQKYSAEVVRKNGTFLL